MDTIRALRDPKRRRKVGPSLRENPEKAWWMGSDKRWRWPMTGIDGGDGGRSFSSFLIDD